MVSQVEEKTLTPGFLPVQGHTKCGGFRNRNARGRFLLKRIDLEKKYVNVLFLPASVCFSTFNPRDAENKTISIIWSMINTILQRNP